MTAAIAGPLAASGWRMTTLDWPGHGRSSDRDPETAIGFGELLSGVREDRGGSQVLLGNSVGGFAAVHTAAHRPDLIAGLVLVSSGGFTLQWFGTTLACRLVDFRWRHAPTAGCPDCTCAITIRLSQMRSPAPRRPPGRVTPGDGL